MSAHVFEISEETFEKDAIKASHEKPVLIDFWAEWCSPCLVIAPIISEVVEEYAGKIVLAKLEVDEGENMRLAGKYQVRGFPTIMLLHKGEEIARFASARPAHWIRDWIDEHTQGIL